MSEQIKRVNRELKFKGTIIDFYKIQWKLMGIIQLYGILSRQRSCGSSSGH